MMIIFIFFFLSVISLHVINSDFDDYFGNSFSYTSSFIILFLIAVSTGFVLFYGEIVLRPFEIEQCTCNCNCNCCK